MSSIALYFLLITPGPYHQSAALIPTPYTLSECEKAASQTKEKASFYLRTVCVPAPSYVKVEK